MDCERIRDLLSDYLEDGLDDGERAVVAAHLDACARCAAEAKGLSETIALLAVLPREKAPPELLDRIMRGIGSEGAGTPGWRRFLSARRVRIPVEAAAAVLLLALVYGIQRGMPVRPGLPAGESGTPRTTAEPMPDASPPTTVASPSPRDAAKGRPGIARSGKTPRPADDGISAAAPTAAREPAAPPAAPAESRVAALAPVAGKAESAGAAPEVERRVGGMHAVPAHPAAKAPPASRLPPAVTAARVSSAEETIEPRVFAAPPSRMLRPLPFGREVTLEVASAERAGIEERVVAAAERLGGGAHPGAAPAAESAQPVAPSAVRVHLPAASAGAFLDALKGLGTIPPDGTPAAVDLPAGPSAGIVAYTVRIRIR